MKKTSNPHLLARMTRNYQNAPTPLHLAILTLSASGACTFHERIPSNLKLFANEVAERNCGQGRWNSGGKDYTVRNESFGGVGATNQADCKLQVSDTVQRFFSPMRTYGAVLGSKVNTSEMSLADQCLEPSLQEDRVQSIGGFLCSKYRSEYHLNRGIAELCDTARASGFRVIRSNERCVVELPLSWTIRMEANIFCKSDSTPPPFRVVTISIDEFRDGSSSYFYWRWMLDGVEYTNTQGRLIGASLEERMMRADVEVRLKAMRAIQDAFEASWRVLHEFRAHATRSWSQCVPF